RPPTGSIVKINFDGAFEKESFRSCSGIVARNAHGEVLVSRAVFHPNVGSPFAAEAIACLWTVKASTKIGWSKVIIEGNALTIIKKCQSDQIDRSEIGVHIRDIHQISQQFGWIRFKHTNNVANQLAHVLANMSLKREEPTYMYGEVPTSPCGEWRQRDSVNQTEIGCAGN
ncbi:hypothetical protein Goari_013926, partial [Gossypium aridum]|nr:hypothetical protein [Gossypium aridum]